VQEIVVILGPTATGKTRLAALVAHQINGEVISADSRQVYRGMDIGTGKDLDDYVVDGEKVPYHLIDIVEPGTEYNVFAFSRDFEAARKAIEERGRRVVVCGGTGMYIEAVTEGYRLHKVPENPGLRKELEGKTLEELVELLTELKEVHNVTDTGERQRAIRAIEIATYYAENPETDKKIPEYRSILIGIDLPRQQVRQNITNRLKYRLEHGMVEEVKTLLDSGLTPSQLKFYGLEYKYLTQYVTGELSYDEMFRLLNTAIHQFAKRQMTWFRRMEKRGQEIRWIDGRLPVGERVRLVVETAGSGSRQ
jgi:tRNA dimethylallyltransferase